MIAVLSVGGVFPVLSQTFRGCIAGVVVDPAGAAVAGSAVVASNTGTGLRRSTITSGTGEFNFPDLPPGEYQLTVTQPGFEKLSVDKAEVAVGKITSLKLSLSLAAQSQTVQVLFNRHNLPIPGPPGLSPASQTPPGDKLSSASFGRISGTAGDYNGATGIGSGEPFNVQLALKIIF